MVNEVEIDQVREHLLAKNALIDGILSFIMHTMAVLRPEMSAGELTELISQCDTNLLIGYNANFGDRRRELIATLHGILPGLVLVVPPGNKFAVYDCSFLLKGPGGILRFIPIGEYAQPAFSTAPGKGDIGGDPVGVRISESWGQGGSGYRITDREWALVEPFLNKWLPQE